MWRYDILVLGILLIFSIFDFALAAPALVQEKHQAIVDVVQIPKDMITVLGKRAGELDKLGKLAEEYLETSKKPVESSDAHASSSSALAVQGPDHGSTNDVQVSEPYPASSTTANDANPDTLMEPLSPSSTHGLWQDGSGYASDDDMPESNDDVLGHPQLTNYGSGHGLTGVHAPQPNLNPNPNPKLPDPDSDWDWDYYYISSEDEEPSLKRPKLEESGHAYEDQVAHMQRPNPGTSNIVGSSSPILPTEPGNGVVTAPAPSPNLGLPMELDDE